MTPRRRLTPFAFPGSAAALGAVSGLLALAALAVVAAFGPARSGRLAPFELVTVLLAGVPVLLTLAIAARTRRADATPKARMRGAYWAPLAVLALCGLALFLAFITADREFEFAALLIVPAAPQVAVLSAPLAGRPSALARLGAWAALLAAASPGMVILMVADASPVGGILYGLESWNGLLSQPVGAEGTGRGFVALAAAWGASAAVDFAVFGAAWAFARRR